MLQIIKNNYIIKAYLPIQQYFLNTKTGRENYWYQYLKAPLSGKYIKNLMLYILFEKKERYILHIIC